MKCGRCGKELKSTDRFCPNCGTPLPVQDDYYTYQPGGGRCEGQQNR